MLTLNISQADIVSANYERIHNPVLAIRKRMDALYWASQEYSRQEAAQLSGVHRSKLARLRRELSRTVPGKANPEKQQQFLDQELLPLIEMAQAGQCHLFFMDAAHFILMPFVGVLWCFARMFIKAASGRNRINVLGALNFVTRKMETVVNTTYVNADTVAELLKKLAQNYTALPLYVVLDNARYQHCHYIKELALSLNIHLVFLPPYSPNLDLIERVWRHIKKDVLGTRYYDCAEKFHNAIRQALNDINHNPETQRSLKSLITPNFQTFAQNLLQ